MISKKRIRKILNFQRPDRIGIYDAYDKKTLEAWRNKGMPEDVWEEDYFGLDFCRFGFDQSIKAGSPESRLKGASVGRPIEDSRNASDKSVSFSFLEPFGHACARFGLQHVLGQLASGSKDLQKFFLNSVKTTIDTYDYLRDRGHKFDCAWAHGNLGYKDGLLISGRAYHRFVMPHQKEVFKHLTKSGLPVIYHSEGNLKEIIPELIEMGVRALEPLEHKCGMDLKKLVKEYKKDLVFFGNISAEKLKTSIPEFKKELLSKLSLVRDNAFYIYRMDAPVPTEIPLSTYKRALEITAEYGTFDNEINKEETHEYKNTA
jgi:hypothetical protein